MTTVSRTAQFAKVHKILKKHYKPVAPRADRSVLEHLMFACCLEDAGFEAAEEAFAALVHTFFDWNEVRVTSLSELSEVMAGLPDPRVTSNRIKRILHGIFEANYSFDLEDKRKKNLGPTVKWLEKLDGATKFTVAYVVQSALSGHQVPIDAGTMAVLRILDLVTEKDAAAGVVPGLERAIGKSKGIEFGSLLHQLGADYTANPFSPAVRELLLQIDPAAKERFRGSRSAECPRKCGPSRPPNRPRARRRQNPRPQNPRPTRPRQAPAVARRPAAKASRAARRRLKPSPPGPPPRPASRPRARGAAARPPRRPPARRGPQPKRPRKRPRRRDSPNANRANV
jgi:endonuclease-3